LMTESDWELAKEERFSQTYTSGLPAQN
jgi:hypothetical protein